jgi:putative phosphoribosyl transferase
MPHFRDRTDAGRQLAAALVGVPLADAVVIGLARGGVVVAAEVAHSLDAPLDAVAVRKIGLPAQPEYAIGATTPGMAGVYLRGDDGLPKHELQRVVVTARAEAEELDAALHAGRPRVELHGKTAVLVDDGLATGATMIAAVRWARAEGAARLVVAVPVAAAQSVGELRREADVVVCPHEEARLLAVGYWYASFEQVGDDEVARLLG